jgi:hypothetical protein
MKDEMGWMREGEGFAWLRATWLGVILARQVAGHDYLSSLAIRTGYEGAHF